MICLTDSQGALERYGVVSQRLPKIVNPVRAARGHDVIVHCARFGS